jgi:hypothetical protein
MQAQNYSDFKSFIEDAVLSVLGAAPEMDSLWLDFCFIEDIETVVLFGINPREKMLEFYAVRPDGLWASFKFPYWDLSDNEGCAYELYKEIVNRLYDFLSEEEENARAFGAADLDTESRWKVVANINDLCEGIDEIYDNMCSFSFMPELDAYVYMLYMAETESMIAIAMNKDCQTASFGIRIREHLDYADPTMIGFRIVGELQKRLNAG